MLSYAAMRYDLEKEIEVFDFPSKETMIEELQAKNLGYDFEKGKHTITMKTNIDKVKQYYIADKLSRNLGDISKVERLPYVDMVTYSFPCTDLSVAGKGEGMVNKCECGHTWDIDFSDANNDICRVCGKRVQKSTRSGLLGQVQRLVSAAKEESTLPKYLLMENVKNLIGKKFKPQFDSWVAWLDSIGYNTYYQVLNAKYCGIPQNRERIFAISIHKDVDTNGYTFPEQIPLTTCLKDVLEQNVDERYYLPDERVEKILNSTLTRNCEKSQDIQERFFRQVAETISENECKPGDTIDAFNKKVNKTGVSPTITTRPEGFKTAILPIVEELEPNTCLIQPKDRDYKKKNQPREVHIESKDDGVSYALRTNGETMVIEPFIAASRGRNPENPSDRTVGAPTEQRLEPNFSGCTNTLTSVQKDNYVCEPQVINVGNIYPSNGQNGNVYDIDGISPTINAGTGVKGNGVGSNNAPKVIIGEPIVYDDYNSRISADQDAINTLTCNCGASAERNGVKIIEPVIVDAIYNNRPARIYNESAPTLRSERFGLEVVEPKDLPCSTRGSQVVSTIRASIYKQGARNLEQNVVNGLGYEGIIESGEPRARWRIRKLTAKECWRLMGFTDQDADKSAGFVSATAQYKQAGNSICTSCLIALFSSLLLKDGHKADVWSKYLIHYSDKNL